MRGLHLISEREDDKKNSGGSIDRILQDRTGCTGSGVDGAT